MRALRNITKHDCECRYENGIFHADGGVSLVVGDLEYGYRVSSRTTIVDLIDKEPDGWTYLNFQHISKSPEGTAYAGETSYGGSGFFAYKLPSGFAWVLHLDNMNNPVSLTRDDDTLIGRVDAPYPHGSVFRIPINRPESFIVVPGI